VNGSSGLRVPPGRILRREQERLGLLAQRSGDDWARACRDADTWLLRAALLGGQRAIRLAADGQPADVTIAWRDTMGIRYPAEATCASPEQASLSLAGTAALDRAAAAHRAALAAAVQHAAVTAAIRTVERVAAATQQRLRAIEDRWVPRLQAALSELELALDELEHADAARLRRAMAAQANTIGRQP